MKHGLADLWGISLTSYRCWVDRKILQKAQLSVTLCRLCVLSPSSSGGNNVWLTICWLVTDFLCELVWLGKFYQCDYFC